MGFGLQGRSAGRRLTFLSQPVAQATAASYHAFSRPSLFISPPCARFVSPRSFAFAVHAPNRILWLLGWGTPCHPIHEHRDLRQTTVRQIEPLLLEEARIGAKNFTGTTAARQTSSSASWRRAALSAAWLLTTASRWAMPLRAGGSQRADWRTCLSRRVTTRNPSAGAFWMKCYSPCARCPIGSASKPSSCLSADPWKTRCATRVFRLHTRQFMLFDLLKKAKVRPASTPHALDRWMTATWSRAPS